METDASRGALPALGQASSSRTVLPRPGRRADLSSRSMRRRPPPRPAEPGTGRARVLDVGSFTRCSFAGVAARPDRCSLGRPSDGVCSAARTTWALNTHRMRGALTGRDRGETIRGQERQTEADSRDTGRLIHTERETDTQSHRDSETETEKGRQTRDSREETGETQKERQGKTEKREKQKEGGGETETRIGFSGQNTGVGFHSLLQGIFPAQGSNPSLPHCWRILQELSHNESPRILEWGAYPFSRRSSRPRNPTRVSCIAGGVFTV